MPASQGCKRGKAPDLSIEILKLLFAMSRLLAHVSQGLQARRLPTQASELAGSATGSWRPLGLQILKLLIEMSGLRARAS